MTYSSQHRQIGEIVSEVPLSAPHYGVSASGAIDRFWRKHVTFTGRASRSEYWRWALVSAAVTLSLVVLCIAVGATGDQATAYGSNAALPSVVLFETFILLWNVVTFLPGLALLVRRLHDGNFSSWLLFLRLVPFIGGIALLVLALQPSNPEGQRFDIRVEAATTS